MGLQVWLPLNNDLHNQGLLNFSDYSQNAFTKESNGKTGPYCYVSGGIIHLTEDSFDNQWSLACWVKSTSWSANNDIVLCKNSHDSGTSQFYFSIINGAYLNLGINGGYNNGAGQYSYTFSTNIWYHIAATYDGTNYAMYINGNKVKSGTCTSSKYSNMINIGIGCRSTSAAGTSSTGNNSKRLNDVRIYDTALSEKEIKLLSQGLILHYPLDRNCWGQNNILTNSTGYQGTTNWTGVISSNVENGQPYLIAKRTDTTSTSRTFVTHSAITSLVNSWNIGDKFTISGYYKIPSTETYAVGGNMFIRWGDSTSTSDTGFTTPTSVTKDVWIRFEKTYTIPDYDTTKSVNFYLSAFSKGLSTIYWKNVKLEWGDKATPWAPSISDTIYSTMGIGSDIEYDASGFQNNGTRKNTFTYTTNSSKYNLATIFNGSNNSIAAGTGAKVKDAITVSCWAYMNSWSSYNGRLLSCTEGGGWNFEPSSGKMNFAMGTGSSSNTYKSVASVTTLSQLGSGWHMFTGTYDGFNTKIYIDGVLENTNAAYTTKTPIYYHSSNGIFVGAEAAASATAPTGSYFNGYLSDVRIYATALSADDILELYNNKAI